MSGLFLKTVNMSISASWLILAVLILRLVLKKAPVKWVNMILWGIAAVRLLFPFSVESALSLIPSAETVSPEIMMDASPTIHTGIAAINSAVNPVISQSFAPPPGASANPLQIWIPVFAAVWVLGIAAFLAYTAATYWRLRKRVNTAVLFRDNIYQSENVSSPFVLGIIRPKVYLPFKLDGRDMGHVIAHESAHIRRRDHWWKPLGFLLLAVYWFNPLMWPSYVLLCRDIELACDERVIRKLDNERRADYTQALLACSANRRRAIAACPLAFGEVGVKERVKSVLLYKKPAFWIVVLAVIACTAVAVCFLTNPVAAEDAANQRENSVVKWFDYLEAPEEMPWDRYLETNRPEFPDVTFRWYPGKMEAATETDIVQLYAGMPIWSVYFYDLTGDGLPELCSTLSFGSGLIDDRIIIHDYANGASYELADRGFYDYTLRLDNEDGCLYVDQRIYHSNELVSSGRLSCSGGYLHIEGDLQTAKENGCAVMEDGVCTWGAEQWAEFCEMTQNGTRASVKVAHYYTLDPARCGADYYEAHKEDYPAMFINNLLYDGKTFTLNWTEQGASYQRQYKYLMRYEDTIPSYLPSQLPQPIIRYVLTNDNTVTWEELLRGSYSSQFGDYIDHFNIFSEAQKAVT